MRKIIIATHGNMADGIKSSLELLVGNVENVTSINAYVEESFDYIKAIENELMTITPGDEVVILTDILAGSVNQRVVPICQKEGVYLIAGINLPLVLEIALYDKPLTPAKIDEIVSQSKEQIVSVKTMMLEQSSTEEGFFE